MSLKKVNLQGTNLEKSVFAETLSGVCVNNLCKQRFVS
ncbi:hypothetical protein IQ264_16790 [Phormidium sp. LEGE 05292]|nr:hypothetical protein [Phormidium sp. LEGE 05292]